MTSDTRREAIAVLAEIWELSPDVRLGQLFAHLGFLGEVHTGHGLGDMEDDEFAAVMQRHKAELQARMSGAGGPGAVPTGSAISVSGLPTTPAK